MEKDNDAEENKVLAAIAYIWILFLVPMFLKKDSAFAQYHAKQGLVLFIFELIVMFLGWVPMIGWFILAPIGSIISLILFIIGLINALSGKKQPLPLIGAYAEKLNI